MGLSENGILREGGGSQQGAGENLFQNEVANDFGRK